VRAVVGVIEGWAPDLYLDLHVTDGTDHQYDVTFGDNGGSGWSPEIHRWIAETLTPGLTQDLRAMGHTPGPLEVANPVDPFDLRKGIVAWVAGPRFSTSYADARHLPALLLEMHSLKPYDRRVLGTYVFLESVQRRIKTADVGRNAWLSISRPTRARGRAQLQAWSTRLSRRGSRIRRCREASALSSPAGP
jgi:hypothetical protein